MPSSSWIAPAGTSPKARVPANLTPVFLPPYSPELNAIERVWLYLHERFLSHRLWPSYEEIVDACCAAWNAPPRRSRPNPIPLLLRLAAAGHDLTESVLLASLCRLSRGGCRKCHQGSGWNAVASGLRPHTPRRPGSARPKGIGPGRRRMPQRTTAAGAGPAGTHSRPALLGVAWMTATPHGVAQAAAISSRRRPSPCRPPSRPACGRGSGSGRWWRC